MRVLVDTSVLVRTVHPDDPQRPIAQRALRTLASGGHQLCILPQNVAEFWAVCTRPAGPNNGLGLSPRLTRRFIRWFEPSFHLLYETAEVYHEWSRLLHERDISGRQIHDVRLVAAATAHGLDRVLTFDVTHFRRYPGIEVVHPRDVSSAKTTP